MRAPITMAVRRDPDSEARCQRGFPGSIIPWAVPVGKLHCQCGELEAPLRETSASCGSEHRDPGGPAAGPAGWPLRVTPPLRFTISNLDKSTFQFRFNWLPERPGRLPCPRPAQSALAEPPLLPHGPQALPVAHRPCAQARHWQRRPSPPWSSLGSGSCTRVPSCMHRCLAPASSRASRGRVQADQMRQNIGGESQSGMFRLLSRFRPIGPLALVSAMSPPCPGSPSATEYPEYPVGARPTSEYSQYPVADWSICRYKPTSGAALAEVATPTNAYRSALADGLAAVSSAHHGGCPSWGTCGTAAQRGGCV